ncbi:ABC transporter substrate-binding protein [Corynebacterium callunae]|uniref:ABC transporter substrate-binding protein n=1 Tax=Corynebacterium callunae TaxID=1721 RepID=UPI001FFE8273|nr:iron-siderophore ABC transporter substrate-binding protein [Corynebacterium callunae]MCK2199533.1 iron-siderophore ABC transporter substrate-binding protein [Corynebacterium callunae]
MQKNISRRSFLGAMIGASALVVAACANSSKDSTASSSTTATTDTEQEQRVVALNTGQLDNLLNLGILPVGVAAAKNADLIPQFLRERFGDKFDLDSIADCGLRAEPDVEAIAALNPTLICANSRAEETVLEKLRAIAPVVTGAGGGENWKEDLVTIAAAVNKEAEAKNLLAAYEAKAAEVAAAQPATPPTVSFLRTNDDAFQMYGLESMTGTVAADCGYGRPAAQQFTDKAGHDLSAELLAEADADWIFYGVQTGAPSPVDTALWPSLTAVQNNKAVEVDYDPWFVNASLVSAEIILEGLSSTIKA